MAQTAVERLRAARDEVTQLSFDALTVPELLNLLGEPQMNRRCTVRHRWCIGTFALPDRVPRRRTNKPIAGPPSRYAPRGRGIRQTCGNRQIIIGGAAEGTV